MLDFNRHYRVSTCYWLYLFCCWVCRTIQRKQKEIKGLKASVEKLGRENERLKTKLDSVLLESSLGARVVKSEVVHEDKDGRKQGADTGGEDEKKDEQPSKEDEEATGGNEGLRTSRSEGK